MRKLITACMALAAFLAFAVVPSVASASPELTYPTGTTLATGSKIKGTLVNGHAVMTTAGGNVTCTTAEMTGTVTSNTGTHFAGNIEKAHFTGHEAENRCDGPFGDVLVTAEFEDAGGTKGVPWCVTGSGSKHEFSIRGGKCDEASRAMTFILHSNTVGECKYSKASVTGTFSTHPDDAIGTISGQTFTKVRGGFLCPSTGSLDMSFTLEVDTEDGTADPIYIS